MILSDELASLRAQLDAFSFTGDAARSMAEQQHVVIGEMVARIKELDAQVAGLADMVVALKADAAPARKSK